MSGVPPRYVPTLTDVVRSLPAAPAAPAVAAPARGEGQRADPPPRAEAQLVSPALLEDRLVQRVMQRVDMVLERRLREVVGELVLAQTQALAPRLREEIAGLVRESVRLETGGNGGARGD